MLIVSATEFQKNFAKYQDAALTQPVTVTHSGRERIVLLSAETYHHMQRYTREVLPVSAFSDTDLADIAAAEPPADNAPLDRELDQDV
jgi:prevent-host-death family protein